MAGRDHFRISSTVLLGVLSALGASRYRTVVFRKPTIADRAGLGERRAG